MKIYGSIAAALLFISSACWAQSDWNKVNIADEYKLKVKMKGAADKSFRKHPTFLNRYTIHQATDMKGSERTASNAVYSEVSLTGISQQQYQDMVNRLYDKWEKELSNIGLQITDGAKVMQCKATQKIKKKDKDKDVVTHTGTMGPVPGKRKLMDGMILGYGANAVTRDLSFFPHNQNTLYTDRKVYGNFFYKVAKDAEVNLIETNFFVSFANFDGGRGYKDIKLETKPVICVNASITITHPKGYTTVFYKKAPIWGGDDWSEGVFKSKDNKGAATYWGLARSVDYQMKANSNAYLKEVEAIIEAWQKDIATGLKAEL